MMEPQTSLYDKILNVIAIIGTIAIIYSFIDHFNRYEDSGFKHPINKIK